jgi:Tol biopolymer transport system component
MDRHRFVMTIGLAAVLGSFFLNENVAAQVTRRVSVATGDLEIPADSWMPAISADGRYIVFGSFGTPLPGDTNGQPDLFVHDRVTSVTEAVSVDSNGNFGDLGAGGLYYPSTISSDGRLIAFYSPSTNLVPNDTNGVLDAFVRDRVAGTTTRVSMSSMGQEGNADSGQPSISSDGRYVAFTSYASNLVPNDTNGFSDVFVRELSTGKTTLISRGVAPADGSSYSPMISPNGRYVAYASDADNLVPNDTNQVLDIFLYDRILDRTTRINVAPNGDEANRSSSALVLSTNGRQVAYASSATNLVPGDLNDSADIFVYDILTGRTIRVSTDSHGGEANADSGAPSISGNGRFVAFHSFADNLVPNDTNGVADIFLKDLLTNQTRRMSVDSDGVEANLPSYVPTITLDGRYVSFDGDATNIVPGDTNGWRDVFVHGPEVTLEVNETEPQAGQTLAFTTYEGIPGQAASLFAVDVDGKTIYQPVVIGIFGPAGDFSVAGTVPPGLSGFTVTFEGIALGRTGMIVESNEVVVAFQ